MCVLTRIHCSTFHFGGANAFAIIHVVTVPRRWRSGNNVGPGPRQDVRPDTARLDCKGVISRLRWRCCQPFSCGSSASVVWLVVIAPVLDFTGIVVLGSLLSYSKKLNHLIGAIVSVGLAPRPYVRTYKPTNQRISKQTRKAARKETYTYTYIHIRTHTHMYVYIYTYIYIYTYVTCIFSYTYVQIHTHIHTFTCTYIHTFLITYTLTTYTHTQLTNVTI